LRDRVTLGSSAPLVLRSRDGSERAIDYSISVLFDRDRELLGSVFIFRDVSQSRHLTQQLTYEAQHDALTGLTNRREFKRCLEAAIASARNDRYHHVLFYIDLDQFKIVNDTCGHGAGDELLRQLAKLLREHIRLTDVLARLGGDEFGLLLHNCPLSRAQQLAHTLRERIAAYQFQWRDMVFSVAASIGIVGIDESTEELAYVLGAADAACYAAKGKGRNRIQLYQAGDRDLERQRRERQWVARIEKALAENRFRLFAQAIAPISSCREDEAQHQPHTEILVRMLDKEGAIVPPMDFIPAAERYGQMPSIDRWVIRTFLRQYQESCQVRDASETQTGGQGCDRMFAINLSGATLSDDRFWPFLEEQLALQTCHPSVCVLKLPKPQQSRICKRRSHLSAS
ncbi:MAG: diguanylate cyclase, partial [Cyanobacteria bacterium J06639_1]